MKRIISALLLTVLLTSLLTSCGTKTPPTPLADVFWGDSQETVLKTIGKSPTDEYDSEGDHYLSFENYKYNGYTGELILGFENDSLYTVRYILPEFDQKAYDHFNDLFTEAKYESFSDGSDMGKVWRSKESVITLLGITMGVGRVIVAFVDVSHKA